MGAGVGGADVTSQPARMVLCASGGDGQALPVCAAAVLLWGLMAVPSLTLPAPYLPPIPILAPNQPPLLPTQPALMALAPCDSTALILNDGRCAGVTERQLYWRQLWWQLAPWLAACSALLVAAPLLNAFIPLRTLPGLLARAHPQRDGQLSAPMLDV